MSSVLTHSLTSVFDVGCLIGGDEESVSELLKFLRLERVYLIAPLKEIIEHDCREVLL